MSAPALVGYAVVGPSARITLDSPHNRNALSAALTQGLVDAVARAVDDDAVRVVVLAAEGPVFCSGLDLTEQRGRDTTGQLAVEPPFPHLLERLWTCPKPVVARVQGHARAGGMGLLAACDVVVAAESATFSFPEVRIGAVPAVISVTCLPRMAPRAALELFLTGETFDAARAADVGLINAVAPDGDLDAAVDRYTSLLSLGGPEALAWTKQVVQRVGGLQVDQLLAEMGQLSRERFGSAEAREGMAARAEKRPPAWVSAAGPVGG